MRELADSGAALLALGGAWRAAHTLPLIAVTGSNGKTTVTALTGQLVERAGKAVAVAGNIGPTLLDTLAQKLDAFRADQTASVLAMTLDPV